MDKIASGSSIDNLIRQRRPGHSLPQDFYVDPAVFERDLDLLAARWSCAGHVSDVAEKGMFLVVELGRESPLW